jgi:RNA polymerase sigma-70 factor (sigma-E family)
VIRASASSLFDEFVRTRSAALGRVAYLLTGHRHDAEDLLQAALARAAVRWERLEDPEAYVRRVLYTQAVSGWRARSRRPAERLGHQPPPAAAPAVEVEVRVVLDQALRRLTARQRAVLVLRYYEDQTEAQAAQLLGCSVGTVKSQTRHALARLRALSPELADLIGGDGEVPAREVVRR